MGCNRKKQVIKIHALLRDKEKISPRQRFIWLMQAKVKPKDPQREKEPPLFPVKS